MTNKTRKVKIGIKGKFQKLWTELLLKRQAKHLGLKLHSVKHHSMHEGEILVSGEQVDLWKFIKNSKSPIFFVKYEKVEFQFLD